MTRKGIVQICDPYGTVEQVFFPRDPDKGRPHKGYVFVQMSRPSEAKALIDNLDGEPDLYGREMLVRSASEGSSTAKKDDDFNPFA